MPLYNFDPADEEGDWESELLEEEKEQQMALHITVSKVSQKYCKDFIKCLVHDWSESATPRKREKVYYNK